MDKDHSEEKKEEQPPQKSPPKITNDTQETDPVRKTVNKKLATMSKETKEAKKNRRRPLKPPKDEVELPNINPMYLLTGVGLIIALLSLYYTRKTAMKEEEEEKEEMEEAKEKVEEEEKPKTPKKVKHHTMDPFFYQRHKNDGIFTFDD